MRELRRSEVVIMLAVATLLAACGGGGGTATPGVGETPAPVEVIALDQGWNDQTRQAFWFTSQGSEIIPYSYFLALEQAANAEPFASPSNFARYRYLPAKSSSLNPDGLPIGFVKHVNANSGIAWIGLTCAACHTSQINYQGKGFLIDGAGTLADFNQWLADLAGALDATLLDSAKFARFANTILGPDHTPAQAQALRSDLDSKSLVVAERVVRNTPPSPPGFGRFDAFGNIFNEMLGNVLDNSASVKPPDAPVSYPFLWTTGQLDLVQWNGFGVNAGALGPLTRNIGEVIGLFGHLEVKTFPYASTIEVANLGEIEGWINTLLSPQWPGQQLPPIDVLKAAAGQPLYNQHCASCHTIIDRTDTSTPVAVTMVPVAMVQTDPTTAVNAANRTGFTGVLQGTKEYFVVGDTFGATAAAGALLTNGVLGVVFAHPFEDIDAILKEYQAVQDAPKFDRESYKARPLNGIWATAPYLHNGSVPNLAQLLLPPLQRMKQFHVGSRDFDPVNVGFITTQTTGAYLFDTTIPGNSNAGHAYATETLTVTQRLELLEFLKTL